MAKTEKKKALGRRNYTWILSGVGLMVLGYVLMAGTQDIYDFRKITLAPLVVLAGVVLVLWGSLLKDKQEESA